MEYRSFNVVSAAAISTTKVVVTFDAPPNGTQAITLTNYSIAGLTLSGAVLAGSTVTLATSVQSAANYTVVVSGVTRAEDGQTPLINSAAFTGLGSFSIVSSESTGNTEVVLTFSDAPEPLSAAMPTSYSIAGLVIHDAAVNGNEAVLTTSPQAAMAYTAVVKLVRAVDNQALTTSSSTFTGRAPFNVVSAASTGVRGFAVTFDAPPDPDEASVATNYSVAGLTPVSMPVLTGNTVAISTMEEQLDGTYTVAVSGNVRRASDDEILAGRTATFAGRASFNVVSAASVDHSHATVTFSHAPDPTAATTLANYKANQGLVLSGVPVLNDKTVTLVTSAQSFLQYAVQVYGVGRAADAEPLTAHLARFVGTP